ncbi:MULTISPECIES: GntR family transcriptional regulator [Actinomycetes]|uniref:GntR family transcriptional regulator n=1 Tax=Streptomyces acidiscabies TaxID=42234 RepID=A0ABU4MHC5_9ACTN|nr:MULTISPECIES: GntR family transcriptional regulator [Actinomycetes]MDX2973479.1 GntR family transcriptional regulator [Kribbella solani]MDX3007048.1 GntR family transcriptional regulator [Kribbella solani]MDX3026093.1 GntR family transcriptional regulator [Streptomyces acidiscabies]
MAAYLKARIDLGTLEPGNKLPPTQALMKQFELSDNAVYRGIALLKAEGYLYSQQGKGVFVSDRRKLIAGEKRIQGIAQRNETIHHKRSVRVQAPEWVAVHLGEGECVNRARTVNRGETVLQASQSWVHVDVAEVVPEIDLPQACDPSWQALYQDRSGNAVTAAAKTMDARITTPEDREALGLEDDFAVLVMRTVYVTGNKVIGVGEGIYAPAHPLSIS